MEPALRVERLTKRFGQITAVDNVELIVQKGEFFGLLGPNGAGKTTTIRMVTGVLKPDSGSITIDGIELARNPLEAKMRMGVIPEVGNVYPDLSALDNVDLVGRYYGLPRMEREERSNVLLDDLGLKERKHDLVRKFSKGMRQRVSIACALVYEPSLLILDEPTEGLDVQSRRLIVDKVKQINQRGSTVILTTHNIEEANRLCQRVCIINKGKVVACDSPEKLRAAFQLTPAVEVAFDRQVDIALLKHPSLQRVDVCGDKLRLLTEDPEAIIEYLVGFRKEHGLRIISLSTAWLSLEDVFVKLCEVPS
ncbi:MAG: ABC transporter ATP-binding protein [Methanomassiliicoccales archaeon]|nr:ABC transporter ATP-binding protein [Methanomassiliicoccales archaeon]